MSAGCSSASAVSLDGVLGKDLVEVGSEFTPVSEEFSGEEKHQYCTECVVRLAEGKTKVLQPLPNPLNLFLFLFSLCLP